MAENKFSLDSFELRSGGINDLPELAVEVHPNVEKAAEGAPSVALAAAEKNPEKNREKNNEKVTTMALAIEESTVSPSAPPQASAVATEPAPKGFMGMIRKVRSTLPLLAKVLPLLDSGVAAAIAPVASALAPQPTVNTKAIERSIAEVQSAQRELRTNLQSHTLQLRRVDEQLVRIREEADHNFREQQEKIEQVRTAVGTLKVIGIISIVLLLIAIGVEGWILLRPVH